MINKVHQRQQHIFLQEERGGVTERPQQNEHNGANIAIRYHSLFDKSEDGPVRDLNLNFFCVLITLKGLQPEIGPDSVLNVLDFIIVDHGGPASGGQSLLLVKKLSPLNEHPTKVIFIRAHEPTI